MKTAEIENMQAAIHIKNGRHGMTNPKKYIASALAGLLLVSTMMLCVQNAQAAIAFRAAAFGGVRQVTVSYRNSGAVASAASGNVTPTLASLEINALLICLVEQHDNVAISFPAGWTQLYSISTSATQRASAFYKKAAATETAPLITHTGGGSITAQCSTFRGGNGVNPLDVAIAAQYAASSTSVTSGSLSTLAANDFMLYAMHVADAPTITVAPTGVGGVIWAQRYYSSTTLGLNSALGLYTGLKAAAGAVGPITTTISAAAENHGVLIALHDGSQLTIAVPTGTVLGDVMIAAIATNPSTVPITAPAGWTLIQAVTQGTATSNRISTYYRVATATEPASYTWLLSTAQTGSAGGIVSYSGVDNAAPIDASAGTATPNSLNHTAPSINPVGSSDILITVHEFASSSSWTPPPGMTERVDIASRPASAAGITLEMNELLLAAAGATGTKTATAAANTDTGGTVSIALKAAQIPPHHIEIDHTGLGCTTIANNVTVKACGDAACSLGGLVTTGVNVTLSPGGNVVAVGASGIGTGTVSSGVAGTVSLSSTSSPVSLNPTTCLNTVSSVATCSYTFQASGFAISVPDGVSGNNVSGTMTACATPFTGAKTINFYTGYSNPASGTKSATINATTIATSSPGTGISLTFNASSQATFTLAYPDVGQVSLNASFTGPPLLTGVTTFVMKPAGFVLSNIKQTAAPNTLNPGAVTAAGAAFVKAGEYFSITVTSVNSAGVATPNFGQSNPPEAVLLSPSLLGSLGLSNNPPINKATTGNITSGSNALTVGSSTGYVAGDRLRVVGAGAAGGDLITTVSVVPSATSLTLAATAGTTVSGTLVHYLLDAFVNGVGTGTHFLWDEVGIIKIMPSIADGSFMTAGNVIGDLTGNPSGAVGRFTLAKFDLQNQPQDDRADLCQGGVLVADGVTPCAPTFTYMGEDIDANFILVPLSLNNVAVQNYLGQNGAGDFAKLNPTIFAGLNLAGADRTTAGQPYYLSTRISNTGMPAVTCASAPCFTSAGADITLPFTLIRKTQPPVCTNPSLDTTCPDGNYTAVDVGIAPLDADGAPVDAVGTFGAGTCNNTTVASCYDLDTDATAGNDHAKVATAEFRYGRMKIANANGSELLPLPITLTAQYWNVTSYATNLADNNTVLAIANISLGNYQRKAGDTWTTTVTLPGGTTASNGTWAATLAKLTGTITGKGSVDITTAAPAYVPYSTAGRASFGVYKGASEFIYLRENH